MRILLTHSPQARELYYGARPRAGLREVGDVELHDGAAPLEGEALISAAADCDLIVSHRQSAAPAALFQRLPKLVAFLRCAIDIRNVVVAAASKAGGPQAAGVVRGRAPKGASTAEHWTGNRKSGPGTN